MKLRLNYWQLVLLFLPFWALASLSLLPLNLRLEYHINLNLAALVITIDLCLAVFYQAYKVIAFVLKLKGSRWMIGHTIIPAIFSALLVIGAISMTASDSNQDKQHIDPVHNSIVSTITGIIFIFTLHMLITFFVINNLYVLGKIDKIRDMSFRDQLNKEFGEPLRKMFIVSLLTIAGSFICFIAIGVIRARYFNDVL